MSDLLPRWPSKTELFFILLSNYCVNRLRFGLLVDKPEEMSFVFQIKSPACVRIRFLGVCYT